MDTKNYYIIECLLSKPPIMCNLASHGHERLKINETKKMEEEELQSECFALFHILVDQLPPKSTV